MHLIQNLDTNLLIFIQENMHTALMDKIMPVITFMGSKGLVWVCIGALLLINKKHRKVGIMLALSLILVTILGEGIIKHVVQRTRPCVDIPTMKMIIKGPTTYSFPSGHTAASFAAAGVLMSNFKKYGLYALILAILIAFSRLYLFVHYPSDVFVGMILGLICAKISSMIVKKFV
ncbi:phosphatase PAP2 family protein [Clostridium sp. P21]|uniref:Phosphatase PAP2 family protein n=1 Tax=Clostridium muellerianum TaxID=2716538 RepID=A0A7Y0HQJ0_9CLOT|nr:phosphatase PAP2 family protein [Clostridium muellerianum]NMM64216.1 phosphatase PAP2 family protein [Clostridium muellerianum]